MWVRNVGIKKRYKTSKTSKKTLIKWITHLVKEWFIRSEKSIMAVILMMIIVLEKIGQIKTLEIMLE